MADLHVIITETAGDGWTIESPQLPGLIGGRNTTEELAADLGEIIEWAKEPGQSFDRLFVHEQHLVTDPDGNEFLIRFLAGGPEGDYEARHMTGMRLNHGVLNGMISDEGYVKHPPVSITGEQLYVCVRGSDTLGWMQDQLLEREGGCVLAELLDDAGAVINIPFGPAGTLPNGVDINKLGLTRDSTFDEMRAAVIDHELASLVGVPGQFSEGTEFRDSLLIAA